MGKVVKEGLEANHVNKHQEEMRNMREGMEANHEKGMREAVERARAEIFNKGSASVTNDAIPNPSMPSTMSELFDDKNTGMAGFE